MTLPLDWPLDAARRLRRITHGSKLLLLLLGAAIFILAESMPLDAADKVKQDGLPAEVKGVLERGTRFVLLSLEPGIRDESAPPFKEKFHGYGVLGKTE